MIYSLDTKVQTRKYRYHDMTLREAILNDLSYVKWMYANKKIEMDREAFEYFCKVAGREQKWSMGSTRRMY